MKFLNISKINFNGENRRALIIILAFFYSTVFYYIQYVLSKNNILSYLIPIIFILVIGICFFYCAQRGHLRFLKLRDILFLFAVLLAIIFSIMTDVDNKNIIIDRYLRIFFIESVPYFLIAFVFMTGDKHQKLIEAFTIFSIFLGVLYVLYMKFIGNPEALSEDNMGLSYNYLPIVILSFIFLLIKKRGRLINAISFFVGLILLVSFGTRGPIVIILSFCFLSFIHFFVNSNIKGKMVWFLVLIVLLIFLAFEFKNIITLLSMFLEKIGMSTRVLDKITQNSIFVDSDRSNITNVVIELIEKKPLTGYGIGGEWKYLNWNAHNMYLSIFQNLGIVIGLLVVIVPLFLSIKAFCIEKNCFIKYMILGWIAIVFVQGFFGGDYLSKDMFFLIGLSVASLRINKNLNCLVKNNELLHIVRL